jgi:hypothetical protein
MCHSGRSPQHGEYFSEPQLTAWNVSENNFPTKGSNSEKLKFVYAMLYWLHLATILSLGFSRLPTTHSELGEDSFMGDDII